LALDAVFQQELTEEMAERFRKSEFTNGIANGIRKAGQLLARQFPASPSDRNELSDDVAHD
jgi:uncharacterized membrane protein